ncbi:MAG: hypothetical protein ACOY3P_05955 [Planctomycetota bacterium]
MPLIWSAVTGVLFVVGSGLLTRHLRTAGVAIVLAVVSVSALRSAEPQPLRGGTKWVRPTDQSPLPRWGIEGGLQFALYPTAIVPGRPGPRGLIRIGFPTLPDGRYDLINFIAIEPVVGGNRGLSELEPSELDGVPGKRIWASAAKSEPRVETIAEAGTIRRLPSGAEELEVVLRIERFVSGAHPYLRVRQRSDAPHEMELAAFAEPDSAAMTACVLTATMGNRIRARELWLAAGPVTSHELYGDYRGTWFAKHAVFPRERLHRTAIGDFLAAITTDEANPSEVFPIPGTKIWHYAGDKVTQYWRRPGAAASAKLSVAVNGRYTYWNSERPIPGGVSFENFEMREPFQDGQTFVFGITRSTPKELGFTEGTEH